MPNLESEPVAIFIRNQAHAWYKNIVSDIFLLFQNSFYCDLSSLANRAQLRYVSV